MSVVLSFYSQQFFLCGKDCKGRLINVNTSCLIMVLLVELLKSLLASKDWKGRLIFVNRSCLSFVLPILASQ